MEDQTANPDLLKIGDTFYMYFRGQQNGHDRIGLATIPESQFDGKTWHIQPEPLIDVGNKGDWDETHVLDPASVLVGNRVFLYYSAVSPRCDRSVCLAISDDGIHFQKYDHNPIVIGGGPEVVYHNGKFYLFFWKTKKSGRGFDLHLAISGDGFHF